MRYTTNNLIDDTTLQVLNTGATKSGKSFFCLDLIKCLKLDKVIIQAFMYERQQPYKLIIDYLKKNDIPYTATDTLDTDELEDILNNYTEEHKLVILDDVLDKNTLKLPVIAGLYSRGRHNHISTIITSQSYYQIPEMIKSNCNLLVMYKSHSFAIDGVFRNRYNKEDAKNLKSIYDNLHKYRQKIGVDENGVPIFKNACLVIHDTENRLLQYRINLNGFNTSFMPKALLKLMES